MRPNEGHHPRPNPSGRHRSRNTALGIVALAFYLVALNLSADCPAQAPPAVGLESPPLPPAESMQALHVRSGFTVELVAAEPLVVDPTAIDWGTDGSLWVVEMADYPLGIDGKGKPGGRIRRLHDTDGDGQYDKADLFLTGIRFPTGILAWRDGVLVTAAPEIFFARDTNGDGVADVRQTLFSGFLEGNQQLRVNGLRRGLDNWIYCASGSHHAGYGADSEILSHKTGKRILLGSRDFRIRPDTGSIDPQSGPSQYGRNRDDWGNWFGVQNSHPLWHYVLSDQYIRRNAHFAPPDPRNQVVTPTNPRVYPAKVSQKRFHSFHHADRFTSACSAMIYRDSLLFPQGTLQHSFTCEPFHSLVQHNVLIEKGVSFAAERDPAETETDFFASSDRWCRPVMVRTGPAGAVWIVDMYRYMIEHPQWLPEEGQDELRPFFRAGDDRGRIYRVFPTNRPPGAMPKLDQMTPRQLVETLSSDNGWQRDVAQYQLVALANSSDREEAITALRDVLQVSHNPRARLHALCSLDGLEALTADLIQAATTDVHPAVRRHAIRLGVKTGVDYSVLEGLLSDDDLKVRLQLASSLGDLAGLRAAEGLAVLGIENAREPMIAAAVMSSLNADNVARLLDLTISRANSLPSSFVETVFSQIASLGDQESIGQAVEAAAEAVGSDSRWKFAALAKLSDVYQQADRSLSERLGESQRVQLAIVVDEARRVAMDSAESEESRALAVRLMFRQPSQANSDMASAAELLTPQTPLLVQQSMVTRISQLSESGLATVLLAGWKGHGPALRAQILRVLTSRRVWSTVLLDSLESNVVSAAEIDSSIRRRLSANQDAAHIARVDRLLEVQTPEERRQVLAEYQQSLELAGDAVRGKIVFDKKCAACHRLQQVGYEVGPNLNSLTDKSPRSLLASILDPSAVVEGKYLDYVVIGHDGRTWTGMLATETGSSITLLAADGKRESILRGDIDTLHSTGKSLMPDGLEKELTKQDMADLLEYVREERVGR